VSCIGSEDALRPGLSEEALSLWDPPVLFLSYLLIVSASLSIPFTSQGVGGKFPRGFVCTEEPKADNVALATFLEEER
jgi:hypothetical protein